MFSHVTMFAELYGKKAAALYTQAQDYQKTARFYYGKVNEKKSPCLRLLFGSLSLDSSLRNTS
jgi:hypothetical protein